MDSIYFSTFDLASYLNKIGDKDDSATSDLVIVHPVFNFDNLCDPSVVRHFAYLISMSAQLYQQVLRPNLVCIVLCGSWAAVADEP